MNTATTYYFLSQNRKAAFSPADIPGLSMHFDFSDENTLNYSSDTSVQYATQKSGSSSLVLGQTNTSKQPIFSSTEYGTGRGGLVFNSGASAQELRLYTDSTLAVTTTLPFSGEYTAFTVSKTYILNIYKFYYGSTGSNEIEGIGETNNFVLRIVNGSSSDIDKPLPVSANIALLVTTQRDASNNVTGGLNSSTMQTFFTGAVPGTRVIEFFGARASQFYWEGSMAESIFYNRQLTVSERNQVEAYLSAKYNLTLT